jgi:hypothetical protein
MKEEYKILTGVLCRFRMWFSVGCTFRMVQATAEFKPQQSFCDNNHRYTTQRYKDTTGSLQHNQTTTAQQNGIRQLLLQHFSTRLQPFYQSIIRLQTFYQSSLRLPPRHSPDYCCCSIAVRDSYCCTVAVQDSHRYTTAVQDYGCIFITT